MEWVVGVDEWEAVELVETGGVEALWRRLECMAAGACMVEAL